MGLITISNVERLTDWWTQSKEARRNRQWAVLLCCLLAVCVLTFAVGVPRLRIYGHDVFVPLEGAWRVLNGQRPIVDFYAVKGPAWYLLNAGGLALSSGAARGLGYANTIVAVLLSVWTFLTLRNRMETIPLFLACVGLVLLAVAPFPLGEYPYQTSFSMTYNRYGYALTGMVLLECFLPENERGSRRKLVGFGSGFSSGLACAVTVFLKISFGLVGLVLVAISLVTRRGKGTRTAGVAAGFALFTLPMMAYLRFDVPAMLHEYSIAAAVRGSGVDGAELVRVVYGDRYEIGVVLVLTVGTLLLHAITVRRGAVLGLAVAAALGGDVMLRATNAQVSDLPLVSIAALLLLNEVTAMLRRRDAPELVPHGVILLCLGLLVVGMRIGPDATGLAGALVDPMLRRHPGFHFKEPQLAALEFFDLKDPNHEREVYDNDNGQPFVRYTEEGIDLARANSRPDESIRGMGNSNPFSYSLLRPPSHGGANDINVTDVSQRLVPPPAMLLGDVDLILIPHYLATEREVMDIVLSAYKGYLTEKYVTAAQSPHWTLLRKK